MRGRRAVLLSLAFVSSSVAGSAQTTSLQQLIAQANQAFAGSSSVSSIVLTGSVESYAGSSQNGTITLTARVDGSSSVQMELGSGASGQTQDTFANGQGCAWSGADGVSHPAVGHNCLVPLAWFLPEVAFFSAQLPATGALSSALTASGPSISWAMTPSVNANAQLTALLTHIGFYSLAFDPSTLLPTSFSYLAHPDSTASIDIPVTIQYSDYRTVSGVSVPFHIQRYFNGVLSLDITISNAALSQ
jgi:hypothetical protein